MSSIVSITGSIEMPDSVNDDQFLSEFTDWIVSKNYYFTGVTGPYVEPSPVSHILENEDHVKELYKFFTGRTDPSTDEFYGVSDDEESNYVSIYWGVNNVDIYDNGMVYAEVSGQGINIDKLTNLLNYLGYHFL